MRAICAELLGYAAGIEFAISYAVAILICEPKIFPLGVAISFFAVWRSQLLKNKRARQFTEKI
jgi:hypothetical protein